MKKVLISLLGATTLAGCVPQGNTQDPAAARQAAATRTSMDAADRETGMPRIHNFAQRKLLKNAYEDMDTTTLTYVYTQALDGRFVCVGQAIGYGVSLGTQFTASTYPQNVPGMYSSEHTTAWLLDQPEPNGLYSPTSGAATIVDLINPANGEAHTAIMEPNIVTVPFPLPTQSVAVQCGGPIDPARVHDATEHNAVAQH